MQQIENSTQNKKASKFENFFIYYPIWLGMSPSTGTPWLQILFSSDGG